MRSFNSHTFHLIRAVGMVFILFMTVLAPLMFAVLVIVSVDRCGAYYRMIDHLKAYGKETAATVGYIDPEYGYAGVHFFDPAGKERFGRLDLHYYSAAVQNSIQPGGQVYIRYIDALVSEHEKVVLVEYRGVVERFLCITPELWGGMAFFWLLLMFRPQVVFVGFVDGKTLMDDAFTLPGGGGRP